MGKNKYNMKEIQQIRLLPMGAEVFSTMEDAMYFFKITLKSKERNGKYYYKRHTIVSEKNENVYVLFQYDGQIIATAILVGQDKEEMVDGSDAYTGFYQFSISSIRVLNESISLEEIKAIDSRIKTFNRAAQHIDIEKLGEIYSLVYLKSDSEDESVVITEGREGKKVSYYTTKYERNPKLRKEAIRLHGVNCEICGLSFEKMYGELGKNYIEVHHKKPLSSLDEEQNVNPKTDLVCVCANCHRMLHKKKNGIIMPEQLRDIISAIPN